MSKLKKNHSRSKIHLTRRYLAVLILGSTICGAFLLTGYEGQLSSAQSADLRIADPAIEQIQLLLAEKESRTAAQRKIDSQLLYAIKMRRGDNQLARVPNLQTGIDIDDQGRVVVDITADVDGSLLGDLGNAGAEVRLVYAQYNSIRAAVPWNQVEAVAEFPQVRFITQKQEGNVWSTTEPASRNSDRMRILAPDFPQRASTVRNRLLSALAKLSQDKRPLASDAGSVQ